MITTKKNKLNEKIKFLSMDEIFEKYKNYGQDLNTDILLDDDLYECKEYPLPEWWGKGWLCGYFSICYASCLTTSELQTDCKKLTLTNKKNGDAENRLE